MTGNEARKASFFVSLPLFCGIPDFFLVKIDLSLSNHLRASHLNSGQL
jgi:hypothetical protein